MPVTKATHDHLKRQLQRAQEDLARAEMARDSAYARRDTARIEAEHWQSKYETLVASRQMTIDAVAATNRMLRNPQTIEALAEAERAASVGASGLLSVVFDGTAQ